MIVYLHLPGLQPVCDTEKLSGDYTNKIRSYRVNSIPIILGLHDLGSIVNHNHTRLQPNENIRFETLSGNCPIGAIYFQAAQYSSANVNFATITNDWNFNIAKSKTYTGNNLNITINNSAPDTYGLLLAANTYTRSTYSELFKVYNTYYGAQTSADFSLPTFPLDLLKDTNNNINYNNLVPIV